MDLFLVRITAGQHKGTYVGTISGFPIASASKKYFLHPEEGMAYRFFEHAARDVQTEMKRLGYQTDLVPATAGKK